MMRVRARAGILVPGVCRWNGYFGEPLVIDELLYRMDHGLIDQARHAHMGVETTNGDGFGIGWYTTDSDQPCRYRSVAPAWNDVNLRELAGHVESPLFLAHIRATTGTPVQQSNCHPFRHKHWLFVHNGAIEDYPVVRRDLLLAVDPELFDDIWGSTDSELLFYLAITFGLEEDPLGGLERAVGFVEETGRRHGVEHPIQMTVGIADGERLWATRYSSEGHSRTLFVSEDISALRALHPEAERLQALGDEDRAIVSEPLGSLPGAWIEVPEATSLIVQPGPDERRPFRPQRP
jgi:predicted glutamine amidotransferase